jgi:hypothetical protein
MLNLLLHMRHDRLQPFAKLGRFLYGRMSFPMWMIQMKNARAQTRRVSFQKRSMDAEI